MAPRTRFDQALADFCARSIDRLTTLTLTDPSAHALLTTVPPLLERALTELTPAVESAARESQESDAASDRQRQAEAELEGHFVKLYNLMQAHYFTTTVTAPEQAELFRQRLMQATGEHTPATFAPLGIERTLDVMGSLLAFAAKSFGEDHRHVKAARSSHARLSAARTGADRQEGEAALAAAALNQARDKARRLYVAARGVLEAALVIEGNRSGVSRFMPALDSIYGGRSGGGGRGEEPDADAPTGTSTSQPAPTDPTEG